MKLLIFVITKTLIKNITFEIHMRVRRFILSLVVLTSTVVSILFLFNKSETYMDIEPQLSNEIYCFPEFQILNGTGTLDIFCKPTEPIKAWEFKIEFEEDKLQANVVNIGGFFGNYETFMSPNISNDSIDNANGTIQKLYGLVLGQGNISENGLLVSIEFTAQNISSVSDITIVNAGVTNESMYLPLEVQNAKIQVYGSIPPWDTNADGNIDYLDVSNIVYHYGDTCSEDDVFDIRRDRIVNYLDVSLLVFNYGG